MAALGRVTVTLAVIGAASGAGVAGYGILSARAAQVETPIAAPRTTVATARLNMTDTVTLTRRFTGQFEAAQETALGFEEGGTIAEVMVREGDAVSRGAVVARLDTRLLTAERTRLVASRAALAAQAELARRTNERQTTLLREGHVAQQRVDETSLQLAQLEASLAEIDAGITATDIRLSKAEIRAPFAGRIGARLLDAGAVASPGTPVVTLLEDAPARFRVALDPALADRLEPGAAVQIETQGVTLPATLALLSPEFDAATRARFAFFDLAEGTNAPPSRASGDIVLTDTRTERGAWVPLSALRQGPRGAWTLLTIDDDATVTIEAAEILHLDGDRAYIRGTFADGTRYIPNGTHRVVQGEAVTMAEAK
jgi:RND family efflux transporter MFP subunit